MTGSVQLSILTLVGTSTVLASMLMGVMNREGKLYELWSKPGDFDNVLVWPAKFVFTIELLNCKGGDNWKVMTVSFFVKVTWEFFC